MDKNSMHGVRESRGFTLVDLMIVIAIISLLLSLAMPGYQDNTIRVKVSEGFGLSAGVKTLVAEACQADPSKPYASVVDLGYSSAISSKHVEWLDATNMFGLLDFGIGSCGTPVIGFRAVNTGADIEPIILLIGQQEGIRMVWTCILDPGDLRHVPANCRDSFPTIT